MLLNDAVSHREAQSCATVLAFLGCRLGGKERIVDTLDVFGGDSRTGIGDSHAYHFAVARRNRSWPPPAMASLALRNRFRNTCCSLARVALYGGDPGRQFDVHLDLCGLELMLQQRERVAL